MDNVSEETVIHTVAAEFGPEVLDSVSGGQVHESERSLTISEAASLGGFIVQCAQFAFHIWQHQKNDALLATSLFEEERLQNLFPSVRGEKKMDVIARVLAKLRPEAFATALKGGSIDACRKAYVGEAINSQNSTEDTTRGSFGGGATVLLPFADENWWIVYRDMGWTPDASDGHGVVQVDVPRGFVTDLASVPSYLWPVLQKTGKHGNAAIYHDYLYWQQGCPREVADRVFDRAMNDMGVEPNTRRIIWAGVRVFGGKFWNDNTVARAAGAKRVLAKFPETPTTSWDEWRQRSDVFSAI